MSESLRGSKTSTSRNNSSGSSGSSSTGGSHQGSHHNSIPHKFSSIVNKVESLINKMNYDKHHNNHHRNDMDKCQSTHKENKRKSKVKAKAQGHYNEVQNNKYDHINTLDSNKRSASIDSLNNLTDNDSFEDREANDSNTTTTTTNTNDIYSDSDDAEIAHITGTTSVQVHRRIELDQLTDETIREFNEQCSSLSHDMEFYNSWQNEEELEQSNAHRQQHVQENENIYDNSTPEVELKRPAADDMKLLIENSLLKDANNNECCSTELDTQLDWLEKLDLQEIQQEKSSPQHTKAETKKPLTHIQQIVNNITQNQSQLTESSLQNLNQIDVDLTHNNEQYNSSINQSNVINGINGATTKTRRTSVASSGSVGRMETILEEPSECKISVKEILQRFETMNKNEVFFKHVLHEMLQIYSKLQKF